jgi:septum formation protein
MKIILASTSLRRKEILSKTNLQFEVHPAEYEEDMTLDLHPYELAKHLSLGKAQSISHKHQHALIIGADTFIVFEDKLLGKPHTPEKAIATLHMLSGKPHFVITGFSIIDTSTNKIFSDIEETKVHFRDLSKEEIEAYVATGEPLDRAGSYAIQEGGAAFVQQVEGDVFNVMGLPLNRLLAVLKSEFQIVAKKIY